MNIEIVAINKILQDQSLEVFKDIDITYFPSTKSEIQFILDHNTEYRTVPDSYTFEAMFPNFPKLEVEESNEYILDKLVENATYSDLHPIAEKFNRLLVEDSVKANEYILDKAEQIKRNRSLKKTKGVDIIKESNKRYQEFQDHADNGGHIGIKLGFPQIDKACGGAQSGDVITIYARPSKGKSWLGIFVAFNAWKQGKRVLIYSGEMDSTAIGYRFDTFNSHISNRCMMFGNECIRKDYSEYIQSLQGKDGVLVVTPSDFHGSPTVNQLESVADDFRADIIIVDQISLMSDQRRGKDRREYYGNIVEDSKIIAGQNGRPRILLAQASRKVEEDKILREGVPPLNMIESSDLIGQHTVKAIGMNEGEGILKLGLTKSRYGERVDEFLKWNKDTGYIEPLMDETSLSDQAEDFGF